jgi:hypothetical protein
MNLQQVIEAAPSFVAAGNLPIHMKSPPGMGKSSIVHEDIPRRLKAMTGNDYPVVEFNLTTIDAPDIRGFLFPSKDANGHATARFTRSPIAQAIIDTQSDTGILFLDERDQAEQLVQKGSAGMIEARMIGDFPIPDGWWIISASNRTQDRSGTGRPLMHLINRECILPIDFSAPGFIQWAEVHDMHPMAVAFARFKPGAIQVDEVPSEPRPFSSARSFTKASAYLGTSAGVDASGNANMTLPWDVVSQQVTAGFIGEGLAADMAGFCKVAGELPTLAQIIKSPDGAKLPPPERLDAQYAALSMAVHGADLQSAEPIFKYILRLNKELQVSAAASLMAKGGGALLNSPSISKWVVDNRALITATLGA